MTTCWRLVATRFTFEVWHFKTTAEILQRLRPSEKSREKVTCILLLRVVAYVMSTQYQSRIQCLTQQGSTVIAATFHRAGECQSQMDVVLGIKMLRIRASDDFIKPGVFLYVTITTRMINTPYLLC